MNPIFAKDFNPIRVAFVKEIMRICMLDQNNVIMSQPESQNWPRPSKPYFTIKIITPGARFGDDDRTNVPDSQGNPTTIFNSGGPRKMTVAFDCFGNTHEEAYNYMCLWQTALDLQDLQQRLEAVGIAVWTIGTVADLSALLNTGYEGRAHLETTFGLAFNIQSDLGAMEEFTILGQITTDQNTVIDTDTSVSNEEE